MTKGRRSAIICKLSTRGTPGETAPKKITKKVEKLLKNLLTNARRCDIIVGHFRTEGKRSRKVLEKVEKTFQKPLDKLKRMWYNKQVAQNAARELKKLQIIDN